jgi:hypothetical protein
MGALLVMSDQERDRLDVMGRVKRKELSVVEAAGLLGLSLRQARRVWKRFAANGAAGLVHGLRGRAANNAIPAEVRARVVKRHQERYADFGPTPACEKLAAEDPALAVSPDTLVRLLKAEGLWRPMRRKRGKHRQRRERRACFGALVQRVPACGCGSPHDWFEGRGPACCLMDLVDDATGQTYARFYPAETTAAAFDAVGRWCALHGIPRALYVDRHAIYRDQDHPERPTQFGRAMAELGVELICARSPQAKGRVERRHAVFQDRLVKEMRLRGIGTIDAANALPDKSFLAEVNRRCAVKPTKADDLHRRLHPRAADLSEVLCVQQRRAVGNDWCVRWHNRWLQIGVEHAGLALAGKRVLVKQKADGTLVLEHQGRTLAWTEIRTRRPDPPPKTKPAVVNNKRWKPAKTHPWQRPIKLLKAG